jgi:hypothetical protein
MKESEREQSQVKTLSELKTFYKKRLVRVRNVTWRLAFIGAYIQSFSVLLLPSYENIYIILLLSGFIIYKSLLGFRNFHLEDLGSNILDII